MTNRGPVEFELKLADLVYSSSTDELVVKKDDLKLLLEMMSDFRNQADQCHSKNLKLLRDIRELAMAAGFEGLEEQMIGV